MSQQPDQHGDQHLVATYEWLIAAGCAILMFWWQSKEDLSDGVVLSFHWGSGCIYDYRQSLVDGV